MKKYLVISTLLCAALLSGCGNNKEEEALMTQAIAESSVTAESSSEKAETVAGPEASSYESKSDAEMNYQTPEDLSAVVTGDAEKDAESYYLTKAEKDAVELDIENLEARYRVGELDRESFEAQRRELKYEEEKLDIKEELLEDALDLLYYQEGLSLPEGEPDKLMEEMRSLKLREHELELREHELEADYRSGNISRDEFISSRTEDIREEEELDRKDELLEKALEMMGYDD